LAARPLTTWVSAMLHLFRFGNRKSVTVMPASRFGNSYIIAQVSESYVDLLVKQGRWFAIEGNGWCATLPTRCASALYAAGYRDLEEIKRDLLDGTIFVKSHSPFVSSVPRLGKESFSELCQSLGIPTKQLPGFLSREEKAVSEFQNGASLETVLATIVGPGLMGPAKRIVKFISMLDPADRARVYAEYISESDDAERQVRTEGSKS